jgi:hypothetical protein
LSFLTPRSVVPGKAILYFMRLLLKLNFCEVFPCLNIMSHNNFHEWLNFNQLSPTNTFKHYELSFMQPQLHPLAIWIFCICQISMEYVDRWIVSHLPRHQASNHKKLHNLVAFVYYNDKIHIISFEELTDALNVTLFDEEIYFHT